MNELLLQLAQLLYILRRPSDLGLEHDFETLHFVLQLLNDCVLLGDYGVEVDDRLCQLLFVLALRAELVQYLGAIYARAVAYE